MSFCWLVSQNAVRISSTRAPLKRISHWRPKADAIFKSMKRQHVIINKTKAHTVSHLHISFSALFALIIYTFMLARSCFAAHFYLQNNFKLLGHVVKLWLCCITDGKLMLKTLICFWVSSKANSWILFVKCKARVMIVDSLIVGKLRCIVWSCPETSQAVCIFCAGSH